MKRIFSLLICVVFAATAIAQNSTVVNDKNAEVRKLNGFHAIEVSHGIDLYLAQGTQEGVAISASNDKYRSNIKTEVINGVLKIYYDDGGTNIHFNWNNRQMKAYVTVKDINMLHASGGSDVYIQGKLHASNLDLHLSGGSDFYGAVDVSKLVAKADGGSDVKISGNAGSLSIDANGGSDFKGYDLSAETCDVDASGGSDVYVTVNKEMNVKASGGSDVSYKGNGVIKNSNTSGGSGVKKRG